MTTADPATEQVAQRLAARGRDALLERLRRAYTQAAEVHADVLSIDRERLDKLVQSAADHADGLQWRRALADVASGELGISLTDALAHPAIVRAQELVGAPSYEESLEALGERQVPDRPASDSSAPWHSMAHPDALEPEAGPEPEPEPKPAAAARPATPPPPEPKAAARPAPPPPPEPKPAAAGPAVPPEPERKPPATGPAPPPEDPHATREWSAHEAAAALETTRIVPAPETAAAGHLPSDEADWESEEPDYDPELDSDYDDDLDDDDDERYRFDSRQAQDPDKLRVTAFHLGGVAGLPTGREGVDLRLSENGLDIMRGDNTILGRLGWPEIDALEVPLSRVRRRRGRVRLIVRTGQGDASFEVPGFTGEELNDRVVPLVKRFGRR